MWPLAPQGTWLFSAMQGLWLRNRKVGSQIVGEDRSRFPGREIVGEGRREGR